jgi:class 3 adenylate cyclase
MNPKLIDSLVNLLAIDKYSHCYAISGGGLFEKELIKTRETIADNLQSMINSDPALANELFTLFGSEEKYKEQLNSLIAQLSLIGKNKNKFNTNLMQMFGFLVGIVPFLIEKIGGTYIPPLLWTSDVIVRNAHFARWGGHLPTEVIFNKNLSSDNFLEIMSQSETIIVFADIRKSQDVMIYSPSQNEFADRMIKFLNRSREMIFQYGGVFDKFTGDGFICYFNKYLSQLINRDYIDSFVSFVKELQDYSSSYFLEWKKILKKLPTEDIGLAIGSDIGKIIFLDIYNHFVAVGESIVWTQRMSSVAKSNEIIINNLLGRNMETRNDVLLESKDFESKGGTFRAEILRFK